MSLVTDTLPGLMRDGGIRDNSQNCCALASALGFAPLCSFSMAGEGGLRFPRARWCLRWSCSGCGFGAAGCGPRRALLSTHGPRWSRLCTSLGWKSTEHGVIAAGGLSQTLCPRGFLGPNSVDTGRGRESSGFALKIHYIAQNRTH